MSFLFLQYYQSPFPPCTHATDALYLKHFTVSLLRLFSLNKMVVNFHEKGKCAADVTRWSVSFLWNLLFTCSHKRWLASAPVCLQFQNPHPQPTSLQHFLVTHFSSSHLCLQTLWGWTTQFLRFIVHEGPLGIMKFCFPAWVWEAHDYKCSSHCLPSSPPNWRQYNETMGSRSSLCVNGMLYGTCQSVKSAVVEVGGTHVDGYLNVHELV